MKTSRSIVVTISIAVITSLFAILIYDSIKSDKIGYVRTGVVLQSYRGIKEVEKQINQELMVVQSNIDTLMKRYEYLTSQYQSAKGKNDKELENRLGKAQEDYMQYKEKAGEQMEQRKNELISKEITTINQRIEFYGKKHGYKLILGSTSDGSIIYGNPAYDITDLIVEMINREQ